MTLQPLEKEKKIFDQDFVETQVTLKILTVVARSALIVKTN